MFNHRMSALFCCIGRTAQFQAACAFVLDGFFSASTSRDLPMPGSPLSKTICPAHLYPFPALTQQAYSWSRPTSGVSPLRATT